MAKGIREFTGVHNLSINAIHCASSRRAISTAEIIADSLNINYIAYDDLLSTKAGKLAGMNEKDAFETNPDFIRQLYLYRKGLYNAYLFTVAEGKENKKNFERRVTSCFRKIIKNNTQNGLVVIITHRSPITTILIDFAKKFYDYPKKYLGYIPLDLGKVSWLKKENNNWEICRINEHIGKITKNIIEGY